MPAQSPYQDYRNMLRKRRLLWAALLIGLPLLLFGIGSFARDMAPFVTLPVFLVTVLFWRYLMSRNDVCPWCGNSFTESWTGKSAAAADGQPHCANCGKP